MSNDITDGGDNPFTRFGATETARDITGDLLKYVKGDYFAGQEARVISLGTRLVVNMLTITVGWIKWVDGEPTETRMGRLDEGFVVPPRSELPDQGQAGWPLDERGKPADPWQRAMKVLMFDEEGGVYTFAAASKGAREELTKLCTVFGRMMREQPDRFPVIELGSSQYKHRDPRISWVKVPVLKIVGTIDRERFGDPKAPIDPPPLPPALPPASPPAADPMF